MKCNVMYTNYVYHVYNMLVVYSMYVKYFLYDKLYVMYIVNCMLVLAYLIKLVSTGNILCNILATPRYI